MQTDKRLRLHVSALFVVAVVALMCYYILDFAPTSTALIGRTTHWSFVAVVGIATVGNLGILYMHAVTPPHPKFLLLPSRKLSIRAHAIGGGFESILAIAAWFTGSATLAVATGLFAILLHVPASYYQTQGTFGMKGINVPGYYYIVTVHAYCAIRLIQTGGDDIVWLERTYIALMAYSYFRIYYLIFLKLNAFRGSQYTVSLLMSGATLMPLIFGASGVISFIFAIGLYLIFFKVVYAPTQSEWSDLFEEKERFSLLDRNLRKQWLALNVTSDENDTVDDLARKAFDELDTDKSGSLSRAEVEKLLETWGASERLQDSFFHHYGDRTSIGFGAFVSTFWLGERSIYVANKNVKADRHEQARIVFEHLDIDNSGFLETPEIEMLLLEWGMDLFEARRYMKKFAGEDLKLSLEEFETQLQPVWRFGYEAIRKNQLVN